MGVEVGHSAVGDEVVLEHRAGKKRLCNCEGSL